MDPLEQAGYLEVSGTHLYTVLHGVADPVARVLLVGQFGGTGIQRIYPGFGGHDFWPRDESKLYDTTIAAWVKALVSSKT